MKNNYTVNYEKGIITMTKEFANRANDITTEEFNILCMLKEKFPQFRITHKTVKVSPTKQTHKGLTLNRMEKYITTFEPAEALKVFYKVMAYNTDIKETKDGEIVEIVNYGKMKKWFLNKYPDYEMTETAFDDMIKTLEELEAEAPLNQISIEDMEENEEEAA